MQSAFRTRASLLSLSLLFASLSAVPVARAQKAKGAKPVAGAQNVKVTKLGYVKLFEVVLEGPAKPIVGKPFVVSALTRDIGKTTMEYYKVVYSKELKYLLRESRKLRGRGIRAASLLAAQYNKDSVLEFTVQRFKTPGSDWKLKADWQDYNPRLSPVGLSERPRRLRSISLPEEPKKPMRTAATPPLTQVSQKQGQHQERTSFVCNSPGRYYLVYRAHVDYEYNQIERQILTGPRTDIAYPDHEDEDRVKTYKTTPKPLKSLTFSRESVIHASLNGECVAAGTKVSSVPAYGLGLDSGESYVASTLSGSVIAPEGSRVISPEVAFVGGTISGAVVGPSGEPVANAAVQLVTNSGADSLVQTDDKGNFIAQIPAEESQLVELLVAGVELISKMSVVQAIPERIVSTPPPFVQPGSKISLDGNFPEVALREPVAAIPSEIDPSRIPGSEGEPSGVGRPPARRREPRSSIPSMTGNPTELAEASQGMEMSEQLLPVGRAVSADGTQAVTTYQMPADLQSFQTQTVLTDSYGNEQEFSTSIFRIVSASIDQEKLRNGQSAEFQYVFAFGPGPEREVLITITTSGPIHYERAGQAQRLHVGPDGRATFVDTVKAQQGSPAGTPFTIDIAISEASI